MTEKKRLCTFVAALKDFAEPAEKEDKKRRFVFSQNTETLEIHIHEIPGEIDGQTIGDYLHGSYPVCKGISPNKLFF